MSVSRYKFLQSMASTFKDIYASERVAKTTADAQFDLYKRQSEFDANKPLSPRQEYDRFNEYQKMVLDTADAYRDTLLKERKALVESEAFTGADEVQQQALLGQFDNAGRNLLRIQNEHLTPEYFNRYQKREVGIDFSGVWDDEMTQGAQGSTVPEQGTPLSENDMATGMGDVLGGNPGTQPSTPSAPQPTESRFRPAPGNVPASQSPYRSATGDLKTPMSDWKWGGSGIRPQKGDEPLSP